MAALRNLTFSAFCRRNVLFVLLSLISFSQLKAQVDISIGTGTVGNGTTTYPAPLQDFYEGSRMQYLYRASELVAAGMGPGFISAIKYNVVSLGTAGLIEQFEIKIAGTTVATLGTTTWEPVSNTYFGPIDYQPTDGINILTLASPFFWNGTDNIVIEICGGGDNTASGTFFTSNPVTPWTTGLSFNGSHTYRADNLDNLCGTATTTNTGTQTTRPNITFSWTPNVICSGNPAGGTISTTTPSVCLGQEFTLSATGTTVAQNINYQWQSSVDNLSWSDITDATNINYTNTQSSTTYYRLEVICTNSGLTSYSNSIQIVSPPLLAGTYTINKALATGGTNFNSFAAANSALKCGISAPVVFNVTAGSGPYTEQLIITPVPGASATNTVTFNGNGNTISFLSTNTNERAVIKLNGAKHIRFDNLIVTASASTTAQYGFGIHLLNDADSNIIRNSTININNTTTSTQYAGIVIGGTATSATTGDGTGVDFNLIENNSVNGAYYGITLIGTGTDAVQNNTIIKNTIQNWYFAGIVVQGSFNALVEGNDILRPLRTASATTFYGIQFTGISTKAMISKNRIHAIFDAQTTATSDFYGIYFTGVNALTGLENMVSNNAIYDIKGNGTIYGMYNLNSDNVGYYFNTIALNTPTSTPATAETTRGFMQSTEAGGIILINNMFTIVRGGAGPKHAIYMNTAITEYHADHNNYYVSPGSNNHIGYNGVNRTLLVNWQSGSGKDPASTSSDPLYTSYATGNLTPTAPELNDLGFASTGITTDINNAVRNPNPDMGAFEFTVPACPTPPVAGISTAVPATVCPNEHVVLSLSGNSAGIGQTYLWETSSSAGGPWVPISSAAIIRTLNINPTVTAYYRAAVTCGANTSYSVPVQLIVATPFPGGTYTINSAVATGGGNFQSFNDAYLALRCGIAGPVVFNVDPASGPYNEQLIIDSIPGTSSTKTITFNGNGRTIRFSSDNDLERAVIKLRGADHIIFDSLVVDATGAGTYGYGVHFMNNADSNVIRRSSVIASTSSTSTNFAGIVMSGTASSATATGNTFSDNNTLDGNTITGGYYGITQIGTANVPNENNRIINNTIRDVYSYGIYINASNNILIENNNISRPTRTAVTTFYGIYFTGLSQRARISKNRIHNAFGGNLTSTSAFYGIYFTGVDAADGSENIVSNNLVFNVTGEGDQYGLYNSSSNNVRYYHNTLSFDYSGSNHTTSYWTRGIHQITLATGIQYKNNLITITRTGAGDRWGIYMSTATTEYESNNNNFYLKGNAGTTFVGYNGTDRVSLSDWQTASTKDGASLAVNPIYIDTAVGNYRPNAEALDNKGVNVNITTDIENTARSASTPDIGAYEFAVPPCVAPPVAGAANANPSSNFCIETPIALKLVGNSSGSGQRYQWQYSISAAGPWTSLGGLLYYPDTTVIANGSFYYRAAVTCSGNTQFSTPVLVSMNPPLLAGVYTINNTLPTGGINYNSFNAAVAALDCGIAGPVTFNIAAGTYNEQVRMHRIRGASNNSRVTFQSANGDPASVNLTYAPLAANDYTLLLDSASYITYRAISISATDTAKAVELANTASFDSIINCRITVLPYTSTGTAMVGIFADDLKGTDNVIKGNTITNGAVGIYIAGTATADRTHRITIDSNLVNGAYQYGIYNNLSNHLRVTKNTVNWGPTLNATSYAIYALDCDSGYVFSDNNINVNDATATTYGLYLSGSNNGPNDRGKIERNKILALNGNTGTLYGLYQTGSNYGDYRNNIISIKTSGVTSYGLYSTAGGNSNVLNNTVLNGSTSTTNNVTAYFSHTSATAGNVRISNNVFSHTGNGKAMQIPNAGFIYSDYNFLYTTGPSIIQYGTANLPTLQAWRDTAYWDINSIVHRPALISDADPRPDIADPEVWAMHGRGVQLAGNDRDHNNNPRPTTLTAGVPDMGAYEFLPTALPVLLTANPGSPAPNTTQTFMLGTDTVTKIRWGATVPSTIQLRRYSGIIPPGLSAGSNHMYFYTDADITGSTPSGYSVDQFYIDPWQNNIAMEGIIKLGRTDAANNWLVSAVSTVDTLANRITEGGLSFIDKFTGLTDGLMPPPPPIVISPADSSNRGRKFWVSYGHHQFFETSNAQNMVLYLSAEQPANVTVTINGTSWVKTYSIPANTVITSDIIPKGGMIDARILTEGKTPRGISIISDVPIVAYAHIYGSTSSGATMLLPVGTWGYEYYALTSRQNYDANTFSWFNIIADQNNTVVEITPSKLTKGGRVAGVPFTVTLNKGEVYQVLGEIISGDDGYDLTGSKIKSIENSQGRCLPIAVFSGSSRTNIGCGTTNPTASGDNIIQQNFPFQAWGRRYLTAPTSHSGGASSFHTNIYKVSVKDPASVVKRNGVQMTGLIDNYYYQFESNTADYIESDKPVMVAQFMASSGTFCPNTDGSGDPEMIYLSPIEQGIKRVGLYRNNVQAITVNYLTLIIPTNGVTSLLINGSNAVDHTYAHPNLPGYSVVVKRWTAAKAQVIVESDSAFTAITYGLGGDESYGYNAGTLVKNLNSIPSITNVYIQGGSVSDYTCAKTPFTMNYLVSIKPNVIEWKFSQVPGLNPNTDVTVNNPVPADSMVLNGRMYYRYTLTQQFNITAPGTYYVPIIITHPEIESCNNRLETTLPITVIAAPISDFSLTYSGCIDGVAQFNGTASTSNGVAITSWAWNFDDGTNSNVQNPTKQFTRADTFNVKLRAIAADGCVADVEKPVIVNPYATVTMAVDSIAVCTGTSAVFNIQNPVAGVTYNWYNAPTGGTLLHTGTSFTATNVTGTVAYYVQAVAAGCTDNNRKRVVTSTLLPLATPVVNVDSVGVDRIRFRWNAIAGASGYEVSINGGNAWTNPSSGATGLTHTVTGLRPLQDVSLMVRAIGSASCQTATSLAVSAKTLPDQIYIPNAFTPNGDGLNDVLKVYGYVIKDLHFMVFNQWGEKIFESRSQSTGWDGRQNGKVQPSGVYMYVCRIILNDGREEIKKGSINLIR